MEPLIRFSSDTWGTTVESAASIKEMFVRFKLHSSFPVIMLKTTIGPEGERIESLSPTDHRGYREYLWKVRDIKRGTELELTLEKR